jgi:hypothetical protein
MHIKCTKNVVVNYVSTSIYHCSLDIVQHLCSFRMNVISEFRKTHVVMFSALCSTSI